VLAILLQGQILDILMKSPAPLYYCNKKKQQKHKGFTFIEILIALTIISVSTALGSLSIANIHKKQITEEATQTLLSNLRLAREKALSGARPDGFSGELTGYRVVFEPAAYKLYYVYIDQLDIEQTILASSYELGNNSLEIIGSPPDISFNTLAQACLPGGTTSIPVRNNDDGNYTCTVVVNCTNGDIKYGGCT